MNTPVATAAGTPAATNGAEAAKAGKNEPKEPPNVIKTVSGFKNACFAVSQAADPCPSLAASSTND